MRRRLVSGASAGQPNLSATWTVQRPQQLQPDLAPVSISFPPPQSTSVIRTSQTIHDPQSLSAQLDLSTAGNSVNSQIATTTPLLGLGREASQDLQDVLASLNLNLDTQSTSNSSAFITSSNSNRSRSGGQRGVGIAGTDHRRTLDPLLSGKQDGDDNNSDEDDEDDETSVEKRLKALVGAALRSPSQRRSSRGGNPIN